MKTKIEKFEVLVPNHDNTDVAERVSVNVPLRWDEEVGEWLLTEAAHRTIEDTKARHMGLLLPPQLKELRERYGYTQKQMGELFQVGEKSWNRWETGKHRPSRSINLAIRALYDGELSIDYLLKRAGKSADEKAWAPTITSAWECIERSVLAALAARDTDENLMYPNVFYRCEGRDEGWRISNLPKQQGYRKANVIGLRKVIRMDRPCPLHEPFPSPFGDRLKSITVG